MTKHPITIHDITVLGKPLKWARWNHPLNREDAMTIDSLAGIYQRFIKPGHMVIDIGAFTGDNTLAMAVCAGKEGHVVAYEPNLGPYEALYNNAVLNTDVTHISVHNVALMPENRTGKHQFFYSDPDHCNGGARHSAPADRVQHTYQLEVSAREVFMELHKVEMNFLKVDTEGMDYHILHEIQAAIVSKRPIIHCEMFPDVAPSTRLDYHQLCRLMNYIPFYFFNAGPPVVLKTSHFVEPKSFFDMLWIPEERVKEFDDYNTSWIVQRNS